MRLLQQLKENDPPVPISKIDCIAEKTTCDKFGISGFPTLKVFKNGAFAYEYDGPRSADGIVKYMASRAGPSSRELKSKEDLDKFLSSSSAVVIGFFSKEGDALQKNFQTAADMLSSDFKFAHTYSKELQSKYDNAVVIFLPKNQKSKFEQDENKYAGSETDSSELQEFLSNNIYGFAGVRTSSNQKYFARRPLIIAYYDVDYIKNPKGTNYWRNRFMKVAKEVAKETSTEFFLAISNANEVGDAAEYGIDHSEGAVHVVARDRKNSKFLMPGEFKMDTFKTWLTSFIQGKEAPYMKSEPVPENNADNNVKVVVAKNFEEIVNDPTRDVLIEFYAPWCGHCKSLEPKYTELADKLAKEGGITIAKMDATANDVPPAYDVKGFPTIYFAPKGDKDSPVQYSGAREVDDFVKYIAKSATDELKGFDRSGNARKSEL